MNTNPVRQAIDAAGSGPKLAAMMGGISARAIYKWAARWDAGNVKAVPDTRAIQLESVVGIPRHVFRPDLWQIEKAA